MQCHLTDWLTVVNYNRRLSFVGGRVRNVACELLIFGVCLFDTFPCVSCVGRWKVDVGIPFATFCGLIWRKKIKTREVRELCHRGRLPKRNAEYGESDENRIEVAQNKIDAVVQWRNTKKNPWMVNINYVRWTPIECLWGDYPQFHWKLSHFVVCGSKRKVRMVLMTSRGSFENKKPFGQCVISFLMKEEEFWLCDVPLVETKSIAWRYRKTYERDAVKSNNKTKRSKVCYFS